MARDTLAPPSAESGGWLSRESTRRFLLLGLELVFLVVIALSLETLFTRANQRFDLTPEKKYSLSSITVQVLRGLTQPVQATVFYRRGDREKHDELFGLMAQESPFFSYQLFDLDRAPGLAQRYGVTAYGATVMEAAGNRLTLPLADEERMLNGLLRISQAEKTIYFLVGHGENDPVDAEERTGYGVLRKVLETENYRVRPLPLLQTRMVPPDANLIVVSGPKEELAPQELQALSAYFAAGGNALFMLDPYTVPGLSRYPVQFGFVLDEDVVVDEQSQVTGGEPLMPMISTFAQDVFPRQLRGEPMLPVVRPVRVQDGKARAFAFSSETSWALKNRERAERNDLTFKAGEDERGPLPVAAVTTVGGDKAGKIVVLGDSDFVDNFYARVPGNVDLFMNTVGWMLGRQELVAIGRTANVPQAKRVATPRQSLYLTAAQSRSFFWIMVVLEPALVFLVGMVVFARRRQKG
ncbi:MAG: GldG family protein [Deltaproteobacteria bacterium]|nr:GldG family protein [Deltaproteobacteria bacterium]